MLKKIFGGIDQNQIIYQLIKTRYAKRGINSFVVLMLAFLVRTLLYFVLSFVILFDNLFVDFFTQCGISIGLCMVSDYIQRFTEHFNEDLYLMTKSIINNYTNENYIKWKNYVVGLLLSFSFLYFYFVDINSRIICIYILQYALCFFFFEIKDNKNHFLRKYLLKPTQKEIAKEAIKEIIKETMNENVKEKLYIINRNIPNTDYVMIEKRKLTEHDISVPQNNSGFDIIE